MSKVTLVRIWIDSLPSGKGWGKENHELRLSWSNGYNHGIKLESRRPESVAEALRNAAWLIERTEKQLTGAGILLG